MGGYQNDCDHRMERHCLFLFRRMDGHFHRCQYCVDKLHDLDQRRMERYQNDCRNGMERGRCLLRRYLDGHFHSREYGVDIFHGVDKRHLERH